MSGNSATTTTIIKQSVNRLLQHTLFVADNDLRRPQFHQTLEAIIAVNYPAIKVIKVRSGKTTALTFEHVGERLEWPLVRAGNRTTATAIIEQGVNGLLQHPLFVANNYLWRPQFHQTLETIVTVDHSTIEIVEI